MAGRTLQAAVPFDRTRRMRQELGAKAVLHRVALNPSGHDTLLGADQSESRVAEARANVHSGQLGERTCVQAEGVRESNTLPQGYQLAKTRQMGNFTVDNFPSTSSTLHSTLLHCSFLF